MSYQSWFFSNPFWIELSFFCIGKSSKFSRTAKLWLFFRKQIFMQERFWVHIFDFVRRAVALQGTTPVWKSWKIYCWMKQLCYVSSEVTSGEEFWKKTISSPLYYQWSVLKTCCLTDHTYRNILEPSLVHGRAFQQDENHCIFQLSSSE